MSKFFKSLLLLLSAGLFTATGWAADPDVTGVIPTDLYTFNGEGNTENAGSSGRTWQGTISVSGAGARGDELTAATGSPWTTKANQNFSQNGCTISVVAKAGNTAENGILLALNENDSNGQTQWAIKRGEADQIVLSTLFTEEYTIDAKDGEFHHIVVSLTKDKVASVYVDGVKQDTSAYTVAEHVQEFRGYQLNAKWGANGLHDNRPSAGGSWLVDDLRIYGTVLTETQITKLNVTLSKYAAIGKCRDLGIAIPENTQVTLTATPSEVTLVDGALAISAPVKTANASDSNSITWKVCVDERHLDLAANKAFADGTYTLTATATEETLVLAEFSSEEAPVLAKAVNVTSETALATAGEYICRTIDGRKKVVAKLTSSESTPTVYGGNPYGTRGTIDADVEISVTGGDYTAIFGGSNADNWASGTTQGINGRVLVEMSGGQSKYLFGGHYKDGSNQNNEKPWIRDDVDVIVFGDAKVTGSIVGAGVGAHNNSVNYGSENKPVNVRVHVKNIQSTNTAGAFLEAMKPGFIAGGGAYATNANTTQNVWGDTYVNIDLPNEIENSTFVKHIVGAGLVDAGGVQRGTPVMKVSSTSNVTISAPNNVTFSGMVIGGGYIDGSGKIPVGNSKVCINGGTFTNGIYAGCYSVNNSAAESTVSGTATLTLNGGNFSEATIAPGKATSSKLVVNNDVTIGTLQTFDEYEVAEGKVLTVNTADLSGVTVPMTLASGTGTLTIGQKRNVTYAGFGSGVVAVTLTAGEIVDAALQLPVTTAVTTAPEVARFALTSETGDTITPTEITLAEGMLTITLPSMYVTVTESKSWSVAVGESSGAVLVVGGATAENATEITIDTAVSNAITEISITGYVKMATEEDVSFPANKVKFAEGAHLELTAPSQTGEWNISSGATLTLIGGEDESATTTLSNKVTVANGGTLETKGYLTLSGENKVIAGGSLKVLTGYTVLYSGENGNGLCGRIEIAYGATLKSTRTDGLHYNGSPEVHVYGTLDMGDKRWTVGTNNKFYIYGGATITGAGDGNGALDFLTGTHTVTIPSANNQGTEIVIPAALRLRDSNTLVKIDAQLVNSEITLSGVIKDNGALQKVGTGNSHLVLSGENKTYSGATTVSNGYLDLVGGTTLATSSIVVNGGTALQFLADANNTATTYSIPITNNGRIDKFDAHTVTLDGVISGAGTLNAKAGTWVLTAANTRQGNVTIDSDATLDVSGENARLGYNGNNLKPIITVNGVLKVRNWEWDDDACLGKVDTNANQLVINGGEIHMMTTQESDRNFTVGTNGAKIVLPEGVTYTYTGNYNSSADSGYLKVNGSLVFDGNGTFAYAGWSDNVKPLRECTISSGTTISSAIRSDQKKIDSIGTLTLADGATLNVENGAITVNGAVNLSDALKIVLPNDTLPTTEAPVTLLNTTAFEGDEGYAYVALTVNGAETEDYILRKTATALTLVPAPDWEDVTSFTATSDVTSWAALLAKMEANSQRFEEGVTPTLIIDFGSEGGEAGTFTFNNKAAITLTSITIQGTNGGTIVMADGVEIAYGTLVLNTTVAADAAFYAANTGVIEGTGKLGLASGELTLDEANTYAGGTDIAAGAKLTITNAGAIGTGAITGAGTLVCDGFMPTNKAGLTDATNWTGTLTLNGINPSQKTGYTLYDLGNASSVLELANFAEAGDDVYLNEGNTLPFTLKVTGTNYFTNGNSNRVIEIAKIAGSGTLVLKGSPTETWKFSGVASDFSGGITVEGGRSVVLGAGNSAGSGKITIASAINIASATLKASGVEVASAGTLSGTGTIDSALTLADNATIDTTGGAVKVTGAVNLPNALTVKITTAPAVGTAVPLLNVSNVTIPEGMTITVMAGEEEAEGSYQLIKTPTALLLENAPAEDVTIEASNIAAAELYAADQMDNYDSHGVQVDLDGPTPYAPGWVSGVCYPLVSVGVVSDADGRVAAGTCVQVVATDDPTVVVATSAPFQNENKEDVTVTSSDTTNTYKLYTFKFETPVYVDAAKTYQFRFVNGEGAAVTCKLRALYTSDNQSYCNWLNAQYEVIDVAGVPPRYAPYVVLTAERTVDNSPICRGGDETLEVTTVPEKIRLNTKTFGYGTHTVLQYIGGTTDWDGMSVEGLPEGAEVIKTGTTWGFAIKTLNVLTVGDSITAGLVTYYNSSANWHVPGGYRLPLYKRLTRAGYTVKYLGASDVFGTYSGGNNPDEANPSPSLGDNDHHEGHSGTTLNEMYDRFGQATAQQVIASQGTPDVITLHLGTNDMQTQAQDTDDSVGNQFDEMKKLIYRLNGVCDTSSTDDWKAEIGTPLYPNAKIIVAKIIPRGDSDNQSKVEKFNLLLTQYVDDCDSNNLVLVTLPMGEGTSYGYYRHDYLHPSTEGYTQMAKGWFAAIDAAFEPFGEATDAPTPVTSTPTADVTEINPATIGIRNSTAKTIGPFKAAEWTTFAEFETGYLSQFGYMLDSERPWQLDVRGTEAPTVENGVLSLNGAPLTVNPVDGRLGTTKSTYTIVMKVSDLAADDVIFTDSSVRNDDWPENVNTNHKGTTNDDLGKLTVVDADTLQWTYNGLADGPEINLTGVNLTDSTPDVIAITVTNNQCKVAVNGGDAVTVSQGSGSESYRGSWSIGAMSTADTGSSMKLYRLSFYEGAATVVMPSEITTAIINVGEGDGQYITWATAKEALKLSDEMESLTINFTADVQTFTFDNDAAVTIDAVTVQGTAGGTIENAGTATVTATNLAINTNVTMNKCYIVDKYTLPIETTNDIAIAQDCALTYYINGEMSTVTVAATHSGAGKIVKTSYGTLEITNTCAVNVDVNQGQFKVNVPINGEKKSIENQKTVKLTGSTLILTSGLSYATFDGDETSIIRVDGDYTFGISNSFTNDLDAGEIQIDAGKTLTIRNFKSGYVLSPSKLLRVNGTLQRDGSHGQDFKVSIPATSTLEGSGTITQAIELADGATVHCAATALAVNTVTFAEGTLNVTGADALANGETVTLFRTTAYAAATGLVEGVVARRAATADETNYRLYKTADAIEVWPSATDAETWTVDAATATTWADVVNQMAAANKRPVDTTALTINFGDKPQDGDAVPGTFTFDGGDAVELAKVTIQGTNGGTIQKTGTGAVTVQVAEVNTATTVTGQVMLNGVTIAESGALSITDWRVIGDNTIAGAGLLTVTGATLPTDVTVRVTDAWTGTVKLTDITDDKLNLANMVTANSNLTLNNVKAYIYDCTINTLTLEGDFQMNNGTTNKSYTQCVTVNTLAGAGTFIGHQSSEVYVAVNVRSWEDFTGAIDLSNEKSNGTIFFFGEAPERFATSITPGNVGAEDSDFTDADYGTLYVTAGEEIVTTAGTTWHLRKLVVDENASFQIKGWATIATSCSGAVSVESGATLDLRALNDLSGINATVKAGGRILVKSGATVPNSIVFESEDAILGICPASVDDIGNATLTVNVNGSAATIAKKKGYKTDGVTLLDNWVNKEDADPNDNTLSFGYDPIFDGELCWWAYEFDKEENTSNKSNLGPISTGRDKTRMTFDDRGNSNRHCEGNEYVVTSEEGKPVTKAIRLASGAYRSATWPAAGFTAAAYGRLTSEHNRVLFAFGQTASSNPTIALATGASANVVQLVLIAGRQDATTPWTPDTTESYASPITVLAETTVPNATTEDHLFAFSYELKDTNDDGTKDATEIIFYVDGDKYQPYKVNKVLTIGGGFQMGTTFGGVPDQYLTRMNEEDVNSTIEFLRVYDDVLPEATFTAMANAYPYISKVGRATRTIEAGADSTWHEATDWEQTEVVLDANGNFTYNDDGSLKFQTENQEEPNYGTIERPEVGTQVFLNVNGANTLYLNEFYSTPLQEGETSKLYYERLEINDVAGGAEDSLTMWAGRLNPDVAEENKNSQSAVLTVLGYTKINTNVTFAHNVAYLSGPVSVAEGKYLHFDFSGFDVMKVPSMPVEYRLTGFLDEETRTRVTSTAPADPVNARSVDLGYKTDVNQYTFKVDRYPVTAFFTEYEMAGGNSTEVNFNNLKYVWQGNDLGKPMNWEAEAVDPQGNPIVENTLAKFVSLDAETKQEKIVTVTLATNDAEPVTLTLAESALSKETTPAGTDAEGNPTVAVVEPMLGEQQLIVGDNVIVNYTGTAATLARTLNEASAETTGVIRTAGFTVDAWRANLSVTGGALAGTGTISGKLTFEAGASLDASAATAGSCLSAKDADLTNLKAITVNVDAAAGKTLKVLDLPAGHTAKSLIGCTVTAVDGEGEIVATWTETGTTATLVVVRADGLYVTGRPVVKAGETEVKNNDLTLPLARRAAELSATSVSLTGVVNMAGKEVDASVADAAEVFTNVAFDMTETPDGEGVVTAKLKYDFGVSQINVVTIEELNGEGETVENQYVVAELIVSNHENPLSNDNTADFAVGAEVNVKVNDVSQTVDQVADMNGSTNNAVTSGKKRYIRFRMPGGNGTFEIKARASKNAQP